MAIPGNDEDFPCSSKAGLLAVFCLGGVLGVPVADVHRDTSQRTREMGEAAGFGTSSWFFEHEVFFRSTFNDVVFWGGSSA